MNKVKLRQLLIDQLAKKVLRVTCKNYVRYGKLNYGLIANIE